MILHSIEPFIVQKLFGRWSVSWVKFHDFSQEFNVVRLEFLVFDHMKRFPLRDTFHDIRQIVASFSVGQSHVRHRERAKEHMHSLQHKSVVFWVIDKNTGAEQVVVAKEKAYELQHKTVREAEC